MRISNIKFLLILAMCFSVATPSLAAIDRIIKTNSISKLAADQFQISARDPYFILPLVRKIETDASSTALSLFLSIDNNGKASTPVEIFYKRVDVKNSDLFDSIFRLRLTLPTANYNHFVIPLPKDLSIQSTSIRLDIDDCRRCKINATPELQLINSEQPGQMNAAFVVSDFQLLNGSTELPKKGRVLDQKGWGLNDLERSGDTVSANGNDPFLVSEELNLNTRDLAGVFFELVVPNSEKPYKFQLFYSTESHAFIERASSIFRVSARENNTDRALSLFIPLEFLSTQLPPARMLKRIRLDLPNNELMDNSWEVTKSLIVNKQDRSRYENLIPEQLLHFKRQKSSARQIIKSIFSKIGKDLLFSIFYTLLLLAVLILMIIKFRKR